MSATDQIALGALAIATVGTALIVMQYALTRRSLDLSVRPLLAEADPPHTGPDDAETIQFGAPGRNAVKVPLASFYANTDGTQISVPFRNIGAGAAVITKCATTPAAGGDVSATRKFVPTGEYVRVNVSRIPRIVQGKPTQDQWWAMEGFIVSVDYTDSAGRQAMTSRAEIRQYATKGPFIEVISIFKKGRSRPLVVSRSTGQI